MSNDSEDRRSDFARWAEEMSYEEEKEYKKQKKREEKELKKQQKLKMKKAKKASDDESPSEEIADAETVEAEAKEAVETAEAVSEASAEAESETTADTSEEAETVAGAEAASETEAEEEDDEPYNPDYKKKKKKSGKSDEVNIVKELLNLIIYIGIVVIICFCIITFVGQRTTVHGHSMSPTLESGDNLWIDKFSYKIGDPKRFDIIVFPYKDTDVFYIKRVIGLPGETVQIAPDGSIIIDGQILQESYGKEIIMDSGTACDPITLGKDEYFVLGDNRNDSRDSRWPDVGNIHKSKIVGKAVFRLSPFSKFGRVK